MTSSVPLTGIRYPSASPLILLSSLLSLFCLWVPSGVPRATLVASYLYLGALLGGLLLLLGFNTTYRPMTPQFLPLAQRLSRTPDSFIQTLHLSTWIANQTSQSGPDKTLSCSSLHPSSTPLLDLINSTSVLPADLARDLGAVLTSSLFLATHIQSMSKPCQPLPPQRTPLCRPLSGAWPLSPSSSAFLPPLWPPSQPETVPTLVSRPSDGSP